VRSGVFAADGSQVLSGGYDRDLRLWDVRTGDTLRTMHGYRGMVYEVGASADGHWGISVNSNSSLSSWDLTTGSLVHVYSTPWRGKPTTSCGDVSPDGAWAAAGDWDDNVYVWDLRPARGAAPR
jgi:WD40 repeat protein